MTSTAHRRAYPAATCAAGATAGSVRVVRTLNLLVVVAPYSSRLMTVNSTSRAVTGSARGALGSPVATRRRRRAWSFSWSLTRWDPSGKVSMMRAGRDLAPFLTLQASSAPVFAAAHQRVKEKKFLSARTSIPALRCPPTTRRSHSACSLVVIASMTAARQARVAVCTNVTSLSWGYSPSAGAG
ncbi:hypothetical protein SAMN06264364_1203 [Quadrisphaera granulorum]|uniref:Uncharacterized protein n=1 Tax=Quadrisphaera granulorum TaxID=317664 RepID=A0A316A254_9ACTN|nr:hypothetical protein BXY45_1203 [Quadrisphaera granulorum]SZE97672.1 hypothetical protein SAMN06264364_1203 [Quadrisphaera granulorum]